MAIMGLVASIAGVMELAFLQSGSPTTGQGYELFVIASAIIGGTALTGGSGSVAGGILGALLIAVIRNGLVLLELSAYWGTVVTGAVIIAAVAIGGFVEKQKRLFSTLHFFLSRPSGLSSAAARNHPTVAPQDCRANQSSVLCCMV